MLMATPNEIISIKELIPSDDSVKWTDVRIAELIDEPLSQAKIMLKYWNIVAASTAGLVDITENTSSRNLTALHSQAMEMVRYWGAISDKEDGQAETYKAGVKIHHITRGART